ncbi:DUF2975 domain-containing protein [Dyadobacter sp. 3J3]|uniref:DUF2975 domain-containing protein n=1 Tax=Dyadobacter sp. 3J3 TaxID=2606600 RepID=UPI0013582D8B|nr:DUF2975 domain-containing protein [Dyadobacter sp. 3J3]
MKNKSIIWVFPFVKRLVSLLYYFVLTALLLFTLLCGLKLLGIQIHNISFQSENVSFGDEPSGYISLPVTFGPISDKTFISSTQPFIYLKPHNLTSQLQVPIRSTSGILMISLGLVSLISVAWTLFLLRRIFMTLQPQSPFHERNTRRITIMGLLFLGQTFIEILLKLILLNQTKPFFKGINLDYPMDIRLDGPWLLGLILLALAQVYQRGIDLQLENDLTI